MVTFHDLKQKKSDVICKKTANEGAPIPHAYP